MNDRTLLRLGAPLVAASAVLAACFPEPPRQAMSDTSQAPDDASDGASDGASDTSLADSDEVIDEVQVDTTPACVCPSLGPCYEPATCTSSPDECQVVTREDGSPCEDGDACTVEDMCRQGICVPGHEPNDRLGDWYLGSDGSGTEVLATHETRGGRRLVLVRMLGRFNQLGGISGHVPATPETAASSLVLLDVTNPSALRSDVLVWTEAPDGDFPALEVGAPIVEVGNRLAIAVTSHDPIKVPDQPSLDTTGSSDQRFTILLVEPDGEIALGWHYQVSNWLFVDFVRALAAMTTTVQGDLLIAGPRLSSRTFSVRGPFPEDLAGGASEATSISTFIERRRPDGSLVWRRWLVPGDSGERFSIASAAGLFERDVAVAGMTSGPLQVQDDLGVEVARLPTGIGTDGFVARFDATGGLVGANHFFSTQDEFVVVNGLGTLSDGRPVALVASRAPISVRTSAEAPPTALTTSEPTEIPNGLDWLVVSLETPPTILRRLVTDPQGYLMARMGRGVSVFGYYRQLAEPATSRSLTFESPELDGVVLAASDGSRTSLEPLIQYAPNAVQPAITMRGAAHYNVFEGQDGSFLIGGSLVASAMGGWMFGVTSFIQPVDHMPRAFISRISSGGGLYCH